MELKQISIIGGGSSGLFAAVDFLLKGWKVVVFEKEEIVGKKLLLAGKSGLNISNTLPLQEFCKRYNEHKEIFTSLIQDFPLESLQNWLRKIDIDVFEGSSGKIFPVSMTADLFLKKIQDSIYSNPSCAVFHGWNFSHFDGNNIVCTSGNEKRTISPPVIFALGGASYPRTGSNGLWIEQFKQEGITCIPFKPVNCGFDIQWSHHFKNLKLPQPIKNCEIIFEENRVRGGMTVTAYGVEGKGIYELSRELRKAIEKNGEAEIFIDFFPDISIEQLKEKLLKERRKLSYSNYLRKTLCIPSIVLQLLYEQYCPKELEKVLQMHPHFLKNFPLKLSGIRSIEEAISSSGGVSFTELTSEFMLVKKKDMYCIGEMIDWDAPTGGYLLHGCFATAARVCKTIQDQHE